MHNANCAALIVPLSLLPSYSTAPTALPHCCAPSALTLQYWKHQVARLEAVRIVLHGQSEFEAHDVVLTGAHTFEVPDGHHMLLTQDVLGESWQG